MRLNDVPQGREVCLQRLCATKEIGGKAEVITTDSKDREMKVITENAATLPKTRIPCPECGHTEAFFVIRQTRAADEPETRIYRCCKCNHSWREY